ncbi:glutaredoxin family protein [Ectobacillus antri]|jgi:glutaredoxin|uniref:Glutaredoxin family protein n=1 Tax=Ectobacillus antri TaxID=2486280 RepID=A0ABT6H768_9BACI|nr:glutaredoxin family protein [Ectobacillus antri]MDG4657149.1 glutaredoxin family protein [Ectobacillus antri]MDG5754608.1 glutaredoxin family protein [Ectobacillus antri]
MNVVLYGKKDCCLCDDAKAILHELQQEHNFIWKEIDIYSDDVLLERYQIMIPVIEIEGEEVQAGIIQKDVISKRLTQGS